MTPVVAALRDAQEERLAASREVRAIELCGADSPGELVAARERLAAADVALADATAARRRVDVTVTLAAYVDADMAYGDLRDNPGTSSGVLQDAKRRKDRAGDGYRAACRAAGDDD